MSDWINPVSGNWADATKWSGGIPNSAGATANFTVASSGSSLTRLISFQEGEDFLVGTLNLVTDADDAWTFQGFTGVTAAILRLGGAGGGPAFVNVDTNGSTRTSSISGSNGLRLVLDSDVIVTTTDSDSLLNISAPITGSGKDIYKFGTGTLRLSASNPLFSGDVFLNGGRLELSVANALDASNLIKINNGATLAATSSLTLSANIETGSGNATGSIVAANARTLTLTGQLELRGTSVTTFGDATDTGTIVLSGTSVAPFAGGIVLRGGIVRFGTADAAANFLAHQGGSRSLDLVGTLDTNGFAATLANFDLDGGFLLSSAGALVVTINDATPPGNDQVGTIVGTAGADRIVVNVTNAFTFAATTFNGWTNGTDTITLLGNDAANAIIGSSQNDLIDGGGGDDTLNGGGGSDTLRGGAGNDIFQISNTLGTLIENANEGTDTIVITSGITVFTLAANFENLTFLGSAQHSGVGNAADNVITGGAGRDELQGLGGNDTLSDGGGAVGNEDTLIGGTGNDIYVVALRGTSTVELAGEGTDEVRTAQPVYELAGNIENLTMSDNATHGAVIGNELANVIHGGTGRDDIFARAGNDTIFGGTGSANTLFGQQGDDLYVIESSGDSVIEFAGEGADTVQTALSTFFLRDHVEALVYTGSGSFLGVGSSTNNSIVGGANADDLNGLDGDDLLIGGSGNDQLQGGNGSDLFRYLGGETGLDRILDFTANADRLQVSSAFFNPVGTLQFRSGAGIAADTANATFLYDTNTGIVSFDRDGTGGAAPVQLAQLNLGLSLTVNDFGLF